VRGYSVVEYLGELVYIKHLTPHDQVELEEITELYHHKAEDRGLPTEKEMLKILEADGDWTKKDEDFIEKTTEYIKSMNAAKRKLVIKSAQDQQSALIKKEEDKLVKKLKQKDDLIGNTCEKYAQTRTHDFYILKSFYKCRDFSEPLYTESQYDELTQPQVSYLVTTYNESFKLFDEESIQYLILEEFYNPYLSFAEDSMQFYGKPFCELTYNQIRMIVYTRVFKNIFDHNPNIPEQIRKDPKALLDFGSISDEEKDKFKSKFEGGDGSTLVGAKKEDYEYLGVEKPTMGRNLHDEAKKKGGSLSMQDMMKLSGV
jgi:hypothetical protein